MVFLLFAGVALLAAESKVVFPDIISRKASVLLPSPCEYVADVVQLVDVSWSENDVASQLKEDSAEITGYVAEHADWRAALATFVDKPIRPLGWDLPSWIDFCFRVNTPFSDDVTPVANGIRSLYLAGGYDFPEAQLEGLQRAVISNEIGWRALQATVDGVPVQRVVVLSTDAIPHLEGDALKAAQKLQDNGESVILPEPNHLTASHMTANGADYGCGTLDYPSVDTVGKAVKDAGVIPVFLVAQPVYTCGDKKCIYPEMKRLATERNNPDYADPEKALETYYTALIKEMDTVGVVVQMGTGFRGLGDAFIQAMEEIGTIPEICAHQKSTESPSSETTTGSQVGSAATTTDSEVGSIETTATTSDTAQTSTAVASTAATTAGAVLTADTGAATQSPESVDCSEAENCTMKINMLIEKCNGEKVEQVLVV